MKIKCGNCGKDILVPDDLVVGQHVRCPYCNEKSAFDKPSRVELPTEIRPILNPVRPSVQREVPDLPSEGKPKLAIRRPPQLTHDHEHMNAAAAAVDARVRMAERKRRIAKVKHFIGNWISIVVLLTFLWIGYNVWKAVRKNEMPAQLPERVTQIISNAVETVNEEIAK